MYEHEDGMFAEFDIDEIKDLPTYTGESLYKTSCDDREYSQEKHSL